MVDPTVILKEFLAMCIEDHELTQHTAYPIYNMAKTRNIDPIILSDNQVWQKVCANPFLWKP